MTLYPPIECQSEALGTVANKTDTHGRCHAANFTATVDIPHGTVCVDGLIQGSIATYQCDEGYELKGNNRMTCHINGDWLGEVSTCEPVGEYM